MKRSVKLVEVTCPNEHRLTYSKGQLRDFACDASKHITATRDQAGFRLDDGVKAKYGLSETSEWTCLSGCTGFGQLRRHAAYSCRLCDFDLCDLCYERALEAHKRMNHVEDVLSKDRRVEWMHSKLMVVGQGGAGKTSTVRSLLGQPFDASWNSTVGASLTQAKVLKKEWSQAEKTRDYVVEAAVKLASLDKYMRRSRPRRHKTSSKPSKQKRKRWPQFRRSRNDVGSPAPPQLQKGEDAEGMIARQGSTIIMDRAEIIGKFDVKVLEKAKQVCDALTLTIYDYGGQTVFYSLHHLLLTQFGVYLIVFDIRALSAAEEESVKFLQFWLNSVNLHASQAPVLLVATHAEGALAKAKPRSRLEVVVRKIIEPFPQVVPHTSRHLSFFPVSNLTSMGKRELRQAVESASLSQAFVHYPVPLSWLRCLDIMSKEGTGTGAKDQVEEDGSTARADDWLPLERVKELASSYNVTSTEEVMEMLHVFHELGEVLHFTGTVALEQVIVVNPQWLIDNLSLLIRDKTLHPYDRRTLETSGVLEDAHRLQATGIASLDLMNYFWGRHSVHFFIDLMRETLLISDWPYASQDTLFLVPSLLPKDRALDEQTTYSHVSRGATVLFDFSGGFLPDGLFQRLVCLGMNYLITKGVSEEPRLDTSSAILYMHEATIHLVLDEKGIWMTVETSSPGPELDLASEYVHAVKSMLRRLNDGVMHGRLRWTVLFQNDYGELETQQFGEGRKSPPWFLKKVQDAQRELRNSMRRATPMDVQGFLDAM